MVSTTTGNVENLGDHATISYSKCFLGLTRCPVGVFGIKSDENCTEAVPLIKILEGERGILIS